jgi:putative ABC transport system permease protein
MEDVSHHQQGVINVFVAWRDLRAARGRFALIAGVVALITVLVGFLSGLTGGLAAQNVSAVLNLDATRIASSAGAQSFTDSSLSADQVAQWQAHAQADPLGISQLRAAHRDTTAGVALFGAPATLDPAVPTASGTVSLSTDGAAALGAGVGDQVQLAGRSYLVDAVTPSAWYSHTPVVWLTLPDWQQINSSTGAGDAAATVMVARGDADWSAIDAAAGTRSSSPLMALPLISAFKSEIGSLGLIIGLLFAISAVVVGAFFVVWGMQRRGDVAILKALGAANGSLRRDSLGQAAVVLAVGVGLGTAVVVAAGLALPSAVPFLLSPLTTLLPAALLIALGLIGAVLALRPVTSADPLTALGSNR